MKQIISTVFLTTLILFKMETQAQNFKTIGRKKTVKEIKKQTAAARSPRPTWTEFVKQITCNI